MKFRRLETQQRALQVEALRLKKTLLKRYVDFSSCAFKHKRLLPDAFEQQYISLDFLDAEEQLYFASTLSGTAVMAKIRHSTILHSYPKSTVCLRISISI